MIPKITHPLGSVWSQPSRNKILVDEKHAVMTLKTCDELAEYSNSMPSGVYPGKMWKRIWGKKQYLVWYGDHVNPKLCSNNCREILIV